MLAEGRNFREIARELGLSRNTVRRFARADSPEELLVNDGTGRQASILDEHGAYPRERWNSGCANAAQLHRELRQRGYQASLDAILAASPELAAVTASVRAFAAIMNERRGRKLLEPLMTAADATGEPALRSFVTGLRADQDAVTNGLSLRWSSGSVEGHVNRIILWNQICQVESVRPAGRR
jgi:transposase